MSDEASVQRRIWLALGSIATVFRCNTGTAWAATAGKPYRTASGDVVVPGGRPIALGLSFPNGDPVTGTHDLLGWTEVVVTADMVGHTVAVFTSIEAKNSEGGRRRPEQKKFAANVQRAGGISGFASSAQQALDIVAEWKKRFAGPPT